MGTVAITGGNPLHGEIGIQGSKNSVLPMIAAALLCRDITTIYNCPKISDVYDMLSILRDAGCDSHWYGHTLVIDTRSIITTQLNKDCTGRIRASVLFLGAMLGREHRVVMGYPGGCDIGKRPIDIHIQGFEKLGVRVELADEKISCEAEELNGDILPLKFPSVGATENLLLASVLAKGKTVIHGAAKEPEIMDLADFLIRMGANIKGAGTQTITVQGVEKLDGIRYYLPYDRIVAGTMMMAATASKGTITLNGITETARIANVIKVMRQLGSEVKMREGSMMVDGHKRPRALNVITGPYPGFPTDLQSMLLVLLAEANGKSQIIESVFEARFRTAQELIKMGAIIHTKDQVATIMGVDKLTGASMSASDLRGAAALILAGLMAEGESIIENLGYMERGYEDLIGDLKRLGADIVYKE